MKYNILTSQLYSIDTYYYQIFDEFILNKKPYLRNRLT